ncbi:MAG: hypothetical protein ACKV2O_22480 [Acidimicrobiales bacterium]
MRGLDVVVGELAREQAGIVTRWQLKKLGMADMSIWRRLDGGGLRRVTPGVFALTSSAPGFAGTAMAAVAAHPGAVVARRWAATWWGLAGFSEQALAGPVELVVGNATHRSGLASIERSRVLEGVDSVPMTAHARRTLMVSAQDRRRMAKGGLGNVRTTAAVPAGNGLTPAVSELLIVPRVTTPARTVIDVIRRWKGSDHQLERLIDDALARSLVTVPMLAECAERVLPPRTPGRAAVRAQLALRGGGFVAPDSELERIGRAAFRGWGCPTPVLGHSVPGRQHVPGQVDFAFPSQQVLIELDGRRWHLSEQGFQTDRDRDRAALLAGWKPYRFTWADFTDRRQVTRGQVQAIFGPT